MSDPDKIELNGIEDLGNPRVVERMDYIVTRGTVYKIVVSDYAGESRLREVDEVPEEYWQRWNDE